MVIALQKADGLLAPRVVSAEADNNARAGVAVINEDLVIRLPVSCVYSQERVATNLHVSADQYQAEMDGSTDVRHVRMTRE